MKQTSAGLVLAPVLLRGSAFFIDLAIIALATLAARGTGIFHFDKDGLPADAATVAALMLFTASYHIGFVMARSATLGKIAMNLYVAYPDGAGVRPDTAILRYLVILAENLFVVGLLLNFVLVFVDPQRRTIHDRIAGTLVLAGRAGAPLKPEDESQQGPSRPL